LLDLPAFARQCRYSWQVGGVRTMLTKRWAMYCGVTIACLAGAYAIAVLLMAMQVCSAT
jgi:hypothetical protein